MTLHILPLDRSTLHGAFSRDRAAVLTIDSGDTVRFSTLDAGWNVEEPWANGGAGRKFEGMVKGADDGHALCGPIAMRGAEPGMTLEIGIGALVTGAWGWTAATGWPSPLNRRLGLHGGQSERLEWTLDREAMTGKDQHGHTVSLHPFMGVMGMPADAPGYQSTTPPRFCGGNMDCKELVTGTSLFLPIAVPGALFSTGDGHGAQGDGESGGTAIECAMESADLTFVLHPDLTITTPRARTNAGWLTFGFDEDLDEAMAVALDAMLTLMNEIHGMSRREAMALASVVVDLRITQVVNTVRGVHAILRHDAFM